MFQVKFLIVIVFAFTVFSCAVKSDSSIKTAVNFALPKVVNTPSDFSDTSDLPPESWFNPRSPVYKRPFQSRARRKKIVFPDDCTDQVGAGERAHPLPKSCIEALRKVHKDLDKAAVDGECSYPVNDFNNRDYPVINNQKILSYTIKNEKETSIYVLTKKLGTVFESFRDNNTLEYPVEFKVGQELKYQKAHYSYSFEPKFYPLSPNKYLVEILCGAGAYNLTNIYLFYDESKLPAKAELLKFPYLQFDYSSNLNDYDESQDVPDAVRKITVSDIHGRYFNPRTKELIVFVLAHGIGDAGRYARYSFPNGKPKLEEFRARIIWSGRGYQVDDVIKSPPKTWKRYYPKQKPNRSTPLRTPNAHR